MADHSKLSHRVVELNHGDAQPIDNPTYLLVHENVKKPLLRALKVTLPAFDRGCRSPAAGEQTKDRDVSKRNGGKIEAFFFADLLRPVHHMAIDFLLQDVIPASSHVFSSSNFGAYTFNSLRPLELLYINHIPPDVLALGPYANETLCSFIAESMVSSVSRFDHSMHGGFKSSVSKVEESAPCGDPFRQQAIESIS